MEATSMTLIMLLLCCNKWSDPMFDLDCTVMNHIYVQNTPFKQSPTDSSPLNTSSKQHFQAMAGNAA
eukprot:5272161-Ditylum_brightwellii.AAC.1